MCVLIFSTSFIRNVSNFIKNWARYDQKRVAVFVYSAGYSGQILKKLELSRQIKKK